MSEPFAGETSPSAAINQRNSLQPCRRRADKFGYRRQTDRLTREVAILHTVRILSTGNPTEMGLEGRLYVPSDVHNRLDVQAEEERFVLYRERC